MTATSLLDQKPQQRISSMRRKDKMWIYKNPQGLLILEDELNERRKKRFSRQRYSPPINNFMQHQQGLDNSDNLASSVVNLPVIATINKIDSTIPDDAIIPIAKHMTHDIDNKSQTVQNNKQDKQTPTNELKRDNIHQKINLYNQKVTEDNYSKQIQKDTVIKKDPIKRHTVQSNINTSQPAKKTEEIIKPINQNNLAEIVNKFKQENTATKLNENGVKKNIINKLQPTKKEETINKFNIDQLQRNTQVSKDPKLEEKSLNKRNFIQERSKMFQQEQVPPKLDIVPKRSMSSSPKREIVPQKSISSIPSQNFLVESKLKLSSTQPKEVLFNESKKLVEVESPIKKRGLVSSFVTALESSSPTIENNSIDKNFTVVSSRSTTSTSPPKPPRHLEPITSKSTVHSTPVEQPSPKRLSTHDSFFSPNISKSITSSKATLPPCNVSTTQVPTDCNKEQENNVLSNADSTINVYFPRLSPGISIDEQDYQSTTQLKKDENNEEFNEDTRPVIKKRVSFSEQLLTYIPEQENDGTNSQQQSPSPTEKKSMFSFFQTVNQELSETKKKLVEERKVNTSPSRDMFIPAVIKKIHQTDGKSSVTSSGPQKLSAKLLDVFQQKLVNPKPLNPQGSLEQVTSKPLVHLTKTRPKKPPSLKKPTYPAATAQPDWRNRATNKKYEFVA